MEQSPRKIIQLGFGLLLVLLLSTCQSPNDNLAKKVNPFIGTGGHGHTYPGASAPFGFMQLSPDTRLEGWDGCGGYHFTDSVIYGFSHTHLSGTGISDYGDLLFMPVTGKARFNNGAVLGVDSGYASRFSHLRETAHAGYYSVHLDDYDIEVELSTSERSGMHRYQFHDGGSRAIVIDLQHRDELINHDLKPYGAKTFGGFRVSKAWAQEQHLYFHFELSETPKHIEFNSDSSKAILGFTDDIEELLVKVGISAVSTKGAQANLKEEIDHWSFDKLRAETEAKWNRELAKIEAEFQDPDQEMVFYTALYHSFLNPNLFQDVDGRYRGTDMQIHQSKNHQQYTIFSLWDTYRATHPLFTISQQKRSLDFIHSFLDHYQKGSRLPMWELAANYTGCMIGYHSVSVIADAYLKGINEFDTQLALEAMLSTAEANELGKTFFLESGYMASNEEHESVSKNLEYAYNAWCIAQFAKALKEDSIAALYYQYAQHYKNIFNPGNGFMQAKRNQQFNEPFNPSEVNFNFTEANSWQYSFYVPHDLSGLIELHGGPRKLEAKLDELFSTNSETAGRHQADITGLIGQYAHGNEPSHHMAYLYNYLNAPQKTQSMVRRILKEMYLNKPDGLIGNEDCGQMSSWYVLSALGFYPVSPGETSYAIGSPIVNQATINLENGQQFKIRCKNQGPENVYIQSMEWNGKAYTKSWIEHDMIMQGGELTFTMGPQPGPSLESPKSSIRQKAITPVPYLKKETLADKSIMVHLHCADPNAKISYSLNDTSDLEIEYSEPFSLSQATVLRMKARAPEKTESSEARAWLEPVNTDRKVIYSSPPDPQYTANGSLSLVDGERGGDDFRTGYWQGWQGKDLELDIDLGPKGENIESIQIGFLQETKSWIFLPKKVVVMVSADGKGFAKIKTLSPTTSDTVKGVVAEDFRCQFTRQNIRKVKFIIQAYGSLPDWHISAGEPSWLFMDEILFN